MKSFLVLMFFSVSSFADQKPLSRFERFVCDKGFSYFNKKFVISYFQTRDLDEAISKLELIESINNELLNDENNVFLMSLK